MTPNFARARMARYPRCWRGEFDVATSGTPVRTSAEIRSGTTSASASRDTTSERMADDHHLVGHFVEYGRNGVGIVSATPGCSGCRRRPEAGQIECDRIERRHETAGEHRSKILVCPSPSMEREAPRCVVAVGLPEHGAPCKRLQHGADHTAIDDPSGDTAATPLSEKGSVSRRCGTCGSDRPDPPGVTQNVPLSTLPYAPKRPRMRQRLCTVATVNDDSNARHLLAGCDDSQEAAITSDAAPLLVVAGAGSGKTRVLTRRIAWRVGNESATCGGVLALTFTRKAASELRERLAGLGLPAPVTAGTFHGIALAQLRQRALDRGRPLPVVVESKARLLAVVVPEWRNRGTGKGTLDRRELLRSIATEIEWAKARCISPEDYLAVASAANRSAVVDLPAVAAAFEAYESERKKRRVYDFDDLLTTLADTIDRDPDFAAAQRWRFRHLFVDELQDANAAQLRLLDAWLGGRPDLFCVGDVCQAIYGWNGADPSAVTSFTARYPGATVLELRANYRSTPQVVHFASSMLDRNDSAPTTTRSDGHVPTITAYADDDEESIGVARELRRAHRLGRRWKDCAVLADPMHSSSLSNAHSSHREFPFVKAVPSSSFRGRRSGTRSTILLPQPPRTRPLARGSGPGRGRA